MKYFIYYQWNLDGKHADKNYEVSKKFALQEYKTNSGSGFWNLSAVPRFQKGTKIRTPSLILWGENINNAECFRRRLKGTLSNEILGV